MKLLIFLVLIIGLYARCRTFPTFNITVPELLGPWYQIAASPWSRRTFERNCVCSYVKYSAGNNEVNLDQSCRDSKPDGRLYRFFGKARVKDQNDPGKLEVEFQGQPGKASLWVVDTDYKDYYITWSCQTILGITFENMWIAARNQTMDMSRFRELAEKAKRITGWDTTQLILTRQTGCTYPSK